jgi:hypothetical protein
VSASKAVHVYPNPGVYLSGVPHVEHDCTDPFCVASGAFSTEPPDEPAEPEPSEETVTEVA